MNKLIPYINANGILLCNNNPYLPSLDDIGSSWNDVTEAIKNQKPITPSAKRIYSLLTPFSEKCV